MRDDRQLLQAGLSGTRTPRLQRLLLANLALLGLAACASTPEPIGLPRSADSLSNLQELLAAGWIDARASGVALDRSKLGGWSSQSLPPTADIYAKKVRNAGSIR